MSFNLQETLQNIRPHLPHQASLKDFIHQNTLESFRKFDFFDALSTASCFFGYQTHLNLNYYQKKFLNGELSVKALEWSIKKFGDNRVNDILDETLWQTETLTTEPSVGKFRNQWDKKYGFDMDQHVHPPLFKLLSAYLDQGISRIEFPTEEDGFLTSVVKNNSAYIFKSPRVKALINNQINPNELLTILISNKSFFETYLWDLVFSCSGWSGFINTIEQHPDSLFIKKKITLSDLCCLELLLEIDALDCFFGLNWSPLGHLTECKPIDFTKLNEGVKSNLAVKIWQNALEWTWYDPVIKGIQSVEKNKIKNSEIKAQFIFCIDDRSCSLRRHVESQDACFVTYGTPGFFGVPIYYKQEGSKFLTKLCPANAEPKHLIIEKKQKNSNLRTIHFNNHNYSLIGGWFMSIGYGFISFINLLYDILNPHSHKSGIAAFNHIKTTSEFIHEYEEQDADSIHNHLQLGFTLQEMTNLAFAFINQLGIKSFSPLLYIIAHGASSQNNPHYSAYDCGACSGRPGSVNAKLMALFLNNPLVRNQLYTKGMLIPENSRFIAALHDTTRDEIEYYDTNTLNEQQYANHENIRNNITKALQNNAVERSRKFESIHLKYNTLKKHKKIIQRSWSLFEPRPELNHATNCLCIIGPRSYSSKLFLDRRAFLNSYDPFNDINGELLSQIIKPIGPVCGGINLEYYFSRTDNKKLGSGTKVPHNIIGLFAVANGIEGDLRPGLPYQMIDLHEPLRLNVIIIQKPEIIHKVLNNNIEVKSWYSKEWIHLTAIDPESLNSYQYYKGAFEPYTPFTDDLKHISRNSILKNKNRNPLPVAILTDEN